MTLAEDATRQFQALAQAGQALPKGEAILMHEGRPLPRVAANMATSRNHTVEETAFWEWRMRCLNAIHAYLGETSHAAKQFEQRVVQPLASDVARGVGMMQALAVDAGSGILFTRISNLVSAEVFSDFLEMAEHLLQRVERGYVPAASLIGAVLEDSLRRLADAKDVSYKPGDDIGVLNAKLASPKTLAYNRVQQRQIETWKAVRDAADHGRFADFKPAEVATMLSGVRQFVATHIG